MSDTHTTMSDTFIWNMMYSVPTDLSRGQGNPGEARSLVVIPISVPRTTSIGDLKQIGKNLARTRFVDCSALEHPCDMCSQPGNGPCVRYLRAAQFVPPDHVTTLQSTEDEPRAEL
jgi:hypothetical protein